MLCLCSPSLQKQPHCLVSVGKTESSGHRVSGSYLRGGCCCRSFCLPSLALGGFPASRGGTGLTAPAAPAPAPAPPASRGLAGGLPPSGAGLGGLPCIPAGGGGLGAFFIGGLSLRGGGMAPGFSGMLEGKESAAFEMINKPSIPPADFWVQRVKAQQR